MNQKQFRHAVAIFCNIATVAFAIFGVYDLFAGDNGTGFNYFCTFTVNSNLLAALCALLMIPFNVRTICRPLTNPPRFLLVLKLIGTVGVTVTILTVMTYLGPVAGFDAMLEGGNLYLHLVCPLLSVFSLLLFELGGDLPVAVSPVGALPVVLYGGVYYYNVLETKLWKDFYGFNQDGYWYLVLIGMIVGSVGLSMGFAALYQLGSEQRKLRVARAHAGGEQAEPSVVPEKDGQWENAPAEAEKSVPVEKGRKQPKNNPKTAQDVLAAVYNGTLEVTDVDTSLLRPSAQLLAKEITRREQTMTAELEKLKKLYRIEEDLLKSMMEENEKSLAGNARELEVTALREMKLEETQAYLNAMREEIRTADEENLRDEVVK